MFPVQHLYRIEIPERLAIESVGLDELPAGWPGMSAPLDATAPVTPLQALGEAWWAARRSVAWVVPSALVPEEPNVLLHPEHPDYPRLRVAHVRAFSFDPRLARKSHSKSSPSRG
jgi:RES domain-containing protein